MAQYPRLFEPLRVRGSTLINRVIMGSMHTGLEEGEGWGADLTKMGAFFAERARGNVGLMVTGGIAPNNAGRVAPFAAMMTTPKDAERHRVVTQAVHEVGSGSKIAMQILHTGRYAYHPFGVSASPRQSPIGWFKPKALSSPEVERTIDDFVQAACLAKEAGYDGVEIMGSEGYLINQFLVPRTNFRTDEWGGSFDNRSRLARTIVEKTREAVGEDFIIIFRLSMLDLVRDGSEWSEVVALGQALENAGVSVINTGIGWHEARVPTIATEVPRGGFSWVTAKLKGSVSVPLVATNRINTPDIAEKILEDGQADMVSMARPFLADPFILMKAEKGDVHRINTCIACNQACLDHSFVMKRASCLVNPRAGYESELIYTKTKNPQSLAVVGGGAAGLAFATVAARRGHNVVLFEAQDSIGGQFNLAKQIPGKEEFHETIRYFKSELKDTGVDVRLGQKVTANQLVDLKFDKVILATGVKPRAIDIEGANHEKVILYNEALDRSKPIGSSVAVVGAGGVGFDVAEFLAHGADETPYAHDRPATMPVVEEFLDKWGIDGNNTVRGGLLDDSDSHKCNREIYLLQRKKGKHGANLGRTTGWIHRANLKKAGVKMLSGVTYDRVNDDGLHITVDGKPKVLNVDTVIVCAGQESVVDLEASLNDHEIPTYRIGGAHLASELDAKRAIDQGSRLAADIENAEAENVGEYLAPLGTSAVMYQKAMKYMK